MESVLRGAAVYFILLAVLRLSGRRTVSEMTSFDLVLILIVAEGTQQALLGNDFSVVNFAILAVTLFGIDITLSYVKRAWSLADKIIDGRPTLLIVSGKPDEHAMKRSRISMGRSWSQHDLSTVLSGSTR